jgi:peptidyl-prolyl cis-trans isomerase B (cyclophilin B)
MVTLLFRVLRACRNWASAADGAATIALVRLAILTLLALSLVGCGDKGGGSTAAGCADVEAPEAKADGGATKPSEPLDETTTYVLVVETSCGDFEITLDQEFAPNTAASLVALANDGFFDNTTFHRIVPGFVIQGGDPTASGSGGPGYKTVDAPPSDAAYTRGVVAMAKTQLEAPGTSGSQFFVVTADDAGLPPEYAIVGEVTQGYDTVERIGAFGDTNEQPTQPVVIERVTVRES